MYCSTRVRISATLAGMSSSRGTTGAAVVVHSQWESEIGYISDIQDFSAPRAEGDWKSGSGRQLVVTFFVQQGLVDGRFLKCVSRKSE